MPPGAVSWGRFCIAYAVLVAAAIVVNFPGRANFNTADILFQTRAPEHLNAWHSPVIGVLYDLLGPVFGHPGGGLVLQALLLMSFPALVLTRLPALPVRWERWAISGGWTFASIFLVALAGQVNKDVLILSFLSAALFCWQARHVPGWSAWHVAMGACLVLAVLARQSGILVALAGVTVLLLVLREGRRRAAIGGAVLLAVMVGGLIAAPLILRPNPAVPELAFMLFDVAGISARTGEDLFLDHPGYRPQPGQLPWDCHEPHGSDVFISGRCAGTLEMVAPRADLFHALWLRAIISHPLTYLSHRAAFAGQVLRQGSTDGEPLLPPPPFVDGVANAASATLPPAMALGLDGWTPRPLFLPFGHVGHRLAAGPLGHPVLSLLVLLAGLGVAALGRRPTESVVAAIGLANLAVIIMLAGSDVARYLLVTQGAALALVGLWIMRAAPDRD